MDSLRILFDFTLPKILLYDPEIEQYDTCMSDYDSGKLKPRLFFVLEEYFLHPPVVHDSVANSIAVYYYFVNCSMILYF